MAKLGFCVQHPSSRINPLLRAGPSVLVCIENPGLIDSVLPLIPDPSKTLFIYRDWSATQPLDDPIQAAKDKVAALKPVIEKSGHKYSGYQLYNEIAQNELRVARQFRDFQLKCMDLLAPYQVKVGVDNDSTWHPAFPEDWPPLWEIKKDVYEHPLATWRCRHEYLSQVHYPGGQHQWFRHQKEIEWLRKKGYKILPHIIDEFGWDRGPPVGPWSMGVTKEQWIQGAKDYKALLTDDVIAYSYFGAGLDQAWPEYNLTSRRAPNGIVQAVADFMRQEQEEPQPDQSWARVPEQVRRWYGLLSAESFRHWPHELIPFKGVQLHGDRIGAAIILCESGGDPTKKSAYPALPEFDPPVHAWGLMMIIPRVPGDARFASRPTIKELLVPAVNVKWGMSIFRGSLMAVGGDLWEALRRYSGFASAKYTLADFWWRYGVKFRDIYKDWFGIDIPEPELDQVVMCKRKLAKAVQGLEAIENIAEATLKEAGIEG